MRPDEHKKKRSAQYNKKKGNKSGKLENKAAEGVCRENPKSRPAQGERKQQQQQHTPAQGVPNHTSATSSSDEEEYVSSHRKTFKRREIVSNWSRYEVTDPESGPEKSVPSAVDYSKLLNVKGNASSHFRFKHEADWEEELSNSHGNQDPITHVLGIDCADLASSLQCLPLFERLGLSADLFPEDQRELLKQDAIKHRQEYSKIREQTYKSGDLTSTGQALWVENENTVARELGGQTSRKSTELSASLIQRDDKHLSGNQICELKPKEQSQCTETNAVNYNSLCNVSEVDRRIDDKPAQNKLDNRVAVSAKLEEELDLLLSMDATSATSDVQNVEITEPMTKNKEGMKSQEDNLEDWLDSILDD